MAASAGGAAGGSELCSMAAAHTCIAGRNLNSGLEATEKSLKQLQKLPAHLLSQFRDVGDVVLAMPGIKRESFLQRHYPQLWMIESTLPVARLE